MLGKFWKVGMTFTWFITEPTFTDIGYISCPTSSITRLLKLVKISVLLPEFWYKTDLPTWSMHWINLGWLMWIWPKAKSPSLGTYKKNKQEELRPVSMTVNTWTFVAAIVFRGERGRPGTKGGRVRMDGNSLQHRNRDVYRYLCHGSLDFVLSTCYFALSHFLISHLSSVIMN